MHTLYSKILFVAIGLLSAKVASSQDSLTIVGGDCETFKKMQRDNIYKDNKIFSGYYIKCDKNNKVINVQFFEKGKFISYVNLAEVDSVLNAQINESIKCNDSKPRMCAPISKDYDSKKECPQISESGKYKNGLFTGNKYIYDKNGLLDKIEIWKEGKYVGDAEVD